jgi:hypothetical protein
MLTSHLTRRQRKQILVMFISRENRLIPDASSSSSITC